MTVFDAHAARVGEFDVRRALPRRGLRTVGPWCFADHMGPAEVTQTRGLDVGPHPHMGLHTVTWLLEGALLHRDSLGSEQEVRPGQLNLMTAGHGIVHAEEATHTYRGTLQGIQLWLAQPEATRHGGSSFAHHADLPGVHLTHGEGTVLIGSFGGVTSPALVDSPAVGVDLDLRAGSSTWPLRRDFAYAVYCARGTLRLGEEVVREGQLLDLESGGDEIAFEVGDQARVLLLGGEPLGEPIVMWWNFVGRSRAEMEQAATDWAAYGTTERFGRVDSRLAPIPAPAMPVLAAR